LLVQTGNQEYFTEIERRATAGSATESEIKQLEERADEQNEKDEQESARTEASIAIMSMATNSSAIMQISGRPLEAVVSTMSSNPRNRRHSLMGLDFIGQLAEEDLTERVVDAGGMDAILIGMKAQLHDEEITRRSLDALAYLATDEDHLEHLIEEGAVPIITEILNRHMAHASSVSSALLMLSLLALVEPGADAISDEAATMDAVCEALWTQRNNEDLLSSEQITEAIEVLVPDEYVSPTLEELFNTIVDVEYPKPEYRKKAMRRSSVSLEAVEAVEEERASVGGTPERSSEPEVDELGRTSRLNAGSQVRLLVEAMRRVLSLTAVLLLRCRKSCYSRFLGWSKHCMR
jgi:hypothetical protein